MRSRRPAASARRCTRTSRSYDIPGYPELAAGALIERLRDQIAPFRPTCHFGQQVVAVEPAGESRWRATTSSGLAIESAAIVIAAGCGAFGANRPPLEGLAEFEGTGSVLYAVRQARDLADKRVVIAGGGDSAVDWALALARHRRARDRGPPPRQVPRRPGERAGACAGSRRPARSIWRYRFNWLRSRARAARSRRSMSPRSTARGGASPPTFCCPSSAWR